MLDANDLLITIKKAAKEAVDAGQPSDFCFGKVTSVSPLKIQVEQKMTLGAAQLLLTRNVTDFKTTVTIDWKSSNSTISHSHGIKDSGVSSDTLTCNPVELSHNHSIFGRKEMTIHNGLQVGDEVILLKKKGGQKYLVLDRVVNA